MNDPKMIFDREGLQKLLQERVANVPSASHLREILARAREKNGLSVDDVAALIVAPREFDQEMFEVSARVRNEIYGNRMVLFAPLYWSNFCANDCAYCSFRTSNKSERRVRLSLDSVVEETTALLDMGHKRIILESGEHAKKNSLDYLVRVIETIYGTKNTHGDQIRRVNVNIAASTVDEYRRLAAANIGTYNLFQETYHQPTYERMHPTTSLKGNFSRQLFAMDRAIEGGLKDLGMGVLYGLSDWKLEVLSLIAHAQYLERTYGIGPHTISVPRICAIRGGTFVPPHPVSDDDFLRLIAIIRMAVPYAGMVVSTRERSEMRMKAFAIGISQTSAGSKTTPGGYAQGVSSGSGQFLTHDDRTLDEVTGDLLRNGFIPSHCTACEFMGREGKQFLPLAKTGEIRAFCQPNSIVTLKEFLRDYASPETRARGELVIARELEYIPEKSNFSIPVLNTATQALPDDIKGWTSKVLKQLDAGNREYQYL